MFHECASRNLDLKLVNSPNDSVLWYALLVSNHRKEHEIFDFCWPILRKPWPSFSTRQIYFSNYRVLLPWQSDISTLMYFSDWIRAERVLHFWKNQHNYPSVWPAVIENMQRSYPCLFISLVLRRQISLLGITC